MYNGTDTTTLKYPKSK